ncbi:MAG: gliding motility-associated-like protein [Crocinitomix sp.]|jgi:gliding motility-associated-like protein
MKWVLLLAVAFSNYSFSHEIKSESMAAVPPPTVLRVNTSAIVDGGEYIVDVKETTTSYESGGTEIITIEGLLESDEIVITIPGAEEGDPIRVVFNIIEGEITNLHGRIDYEDETHDVYFDNQQFFTSEGTTLTVHDTDQNDIPIENPIFLSLENGLVFTPNGDAAYDEISLVMNEEFNVTNVEFSKLDGTVVFTTEDKNFSWDGMIDGTLIDQGVYNYTIIIDDETMQGQFLVQY